MNLTSRLTNVRSFRASYIGTRLKPPNNFRSVRLRSAIHHCWVLEESTLYKVDIMLTLAPVIQVKFTVKKITAIIDIISSSRSGIPLLLDHCPTTTKPQTFEHYSISVSLDLFVCVSAWFRNDVVSWKQNDRPRQIDTRTGRTLIVKALLSALLPTYQKLRGTVIKMMPCTNAAGVLGDSFSSCPQVTRM